MAELLICIVDASEAGWSGADADLARAVEEGSTGDDAGGVTAPLEPHRCSFPEFVQHLNLFLAAFCCLDRKNSLAVLAHSERGGGYVWPPAAARTAPAGFLEMLRPAAVKAECLAQLYRLRYGDALYAALAGEEPPPLPAAASADSAAPTSGSLAQSLSLAVCYLAARRRDTPGLPARILVCAAAADAPHAYIPSINAVFSAQRFGVPVDALLLGDTDSTVLQQAADLTRGMYVRPSPEQHRLLFQFMASQLLPGAASRGLLLLPPPQSVDLRASCFCHRRHVDLAFVCSVCLALWCVPRSPCPVCGCEAAGAVMAARPGAPVLAVAPARGEAGSASA